MERNIIHLDLDAFFVAVECKNNRKLTGKPLIIGGSSRRGVVAACSYETRRFGVHSAMPMYLALQLCPDAKVISGDMESYSKNSHEVTEIIAESSLLFLKNPPLMNFTLTPAEWTGTSVPSNGRWNCEEKL